MIVGNCPRCRKHSLKEVNESEVIGTTQCAMGKKVLMKRIQLGVKCPLCNYNNIRMNIIDGSGHKVA